MPIEISTRKLKKDDLQPKKFLYHAPYVPVYQHGYGRMDSSTPGQGLMAWSVGLAIVVHCPTTGRTILTHSQNWLYKETFAPIVDWVTGGQGQDLFLPAWYKGAGAVACEVEVVVLRGSLHASAEAAGYGHDEWIKDFRRIFSMFITARHIRVSILDPKQILPHDAILVDKDTARITYLEVEGRARSRSFNDNCLELDNPLLPQVYSSAQRYRDLFVGMLIKTQGARTAIFLQYDVSHYCLPMPLPDDGRQLIRSKRLGEPVESQRAILKNLNKPTELTDSPLTFDMSDGQLLLHCLNESAVHFGPPCERCGESGSKRCTLCMGAFYCGKEHQKDDWKSHKGWCKAHRIVGSQK